MNTASFRPFKELFVFSLPVILGQLGLMLIGAGDMYMATKHSTVALAAIGLAVAVCNPVFVVGIAFHFALSPLIAKRRGEGRKTESLLASSVAYSLGLSIPFAIATYLASYLVPLLGYEPIIEKHIIDYVRISTLSIPGAFLYTTVREWLQAHERTIFANVISLLAVLLNLWLNWAFIFGQHGLPNLGVNGLAWASLTVRWVMGIVIILPFIKTLIKEWQLDWPFIKETLTLGGPTALSIFFEVMAFCSVTLFVGKFGEVQTAANNLVLTLASITFMIPLSVAQAVGVKVGHAYGEKNLLRIKGFAKYGLLMSVGFMFFSSTMYALFPQYILGIFGAEDAVFTTGLSFLVWVCLFQVFDGAQVTLAAILRGLGISREVSVITFIGYWICGIPLGWYLSFHVGQQGRGLWMGLATSLALVAITLGWLTRKKVLEISVTSDDTRGAAVLQNATENI